MFGHEPYACLIVRDAVAPVAGLMLMILSQLIDDTTWMLPLGIATTGTGAITATD